MYIYSTVIYSYPPISSLCSQLHLYLLASLARWFLTIWLQICPFEFKSLSIGERFHFENACCLPSLRWEKRFHFERGFIIKIYILTINHLIVFKMPTLGHIVQKQTIINVVISWVTRAVLMMPCNTPRMHAQIITCEI